MNSTGQYIQSLVKESGHRQSDIARSVGVPRQLLSYVITGKRELSMPLALKLESFFNLPEGKLLKMQAEESVRKYKQKLREELVGELLKINAFWSYSDVLAADIPDEELIEKVFTYLDLRDIAKLFELYPREYIRKVWRERMAVQGDYLFNLNVMIALYYFDIRQPEKYLRRVEREYIKQRLGYA
ncbi:MAG: helix-turn-helix domain-containing protein [Rikenellaceae bacterium]|jgi:plasmid maintenance system antidote protein VapI|nr:helix-turn-helix domain-containing protein [Rikenellaceae bacterium]